MNRYIHFFLTFTVIAIALFVFDIIFHGVLIKGYYEQTANLWRSENEMQNLVLFNIATYLSSSFIAVVIFEQFVLKLDKKDLLKNCFKISILITTLIGIIMVRFYVFIPMTLSLSFFWFINAIFHGVIVGLILYSFNKNKSLK